MAELLTGVTEVMTTVGSVLSTTAETITSTPLLTLTAVALPVISFGVGLLIRVMHRA
jgi:hypothetical protein